MCACEAQSRPLFYFFAAATCVKNTRCPTTPHPQVRGRPPAVPREAHFPATPFVAQSLCDGLRCEGTATVLACRSVHVRLGYDMSMQSGGPSHLGEGHDLACKCHCDDWAPRNPAHRAQGPPRCDPPGTRRHGPFCGECPSWDGRRRPTTLQEGHTAKRARVAMALHAPPLNLKPCPTLGR